MPCRGSLRLPAPPHTHTYPLQCVQFLVHLLPLIIKEQLFWVNFVTATVLVTRLQGWGLWAFLRLAEVGARTVLPAG